MRRYCKTILLFCCVFTPLKPGFADEASILKAYDNAMVACISALFQADREMAAKVYDGEGFAWTAERDGAMQACMKKQGFSMPFDQSSRIGGPGVTDPDPMTPEEIRSNFRGGILKYAGPEALAEIDAYTAAAKASLASGKEGEARGAPGLPLSSSASPEEGAAPASAPPTPNPSLDTGNKTYLYVPSEKDDGPKPIWLNVR